MNRNLLSFALTTMVAGIGLTANAYADTCQSLTTNANWNALVQQMHEEVQAETYDKAAQTIQNLIEICPNEPTVHYSAAMMYRKLKDNEKAYQHLTVATQNIKNFDINDDLTQNIWFAFYEISNPGVIDFLNGDTNIAYQKILKNHKIELQTYQLQSDRDRRLANTLLWTGTSFGIIGVLLGAAGGTLMALYADEKEYEATLDKTHITLQRVNGMYDMGTAFLAAGIGTTLVSAIVAGIGGYRLTHHKVQSDANTQASISFHMSMNEASIQFKF